MDRWTSSILKGKEVSPMNGPSFVQFPYDSNIRYLPLIYFLPEDLFSQPSADCRGTCPLSPPRRN